MDSPLAMQFNEFDTDGDGRINDNQTYELMKVLGKNVYIGSVRQAMKHLNYADPHQHGITFDQFKEYFDSYESEAKHALWKYKYDVLSSIQEMREGEGEESTISTAAPGAGGHSEEVPLQGSLRLTIGPENAEYESFVEIQLEKEKKEETKPFLKIVLEQETPQSAKELQTLVNTVYKTSVELIKGYSPEYNQITESIHLMTNTVENKVNLFVTTSNDLLVDVGILVSEYFDRIFASSVSAHLYFKHQFSIDIPKLLEKESDYTFYHGVTKNSKTSLKWYGQNFKNATKSLLKKQKAFSDFYYDKTQPELLSLIGLLHLENCDVELCFDNAQFEVAELESKEFILEELSQLLQELNELSTDKELGLKSIFELLNNKFYIEASIGDWKAKVQINVKDLNKILLKDPK